MDFLIKGKITESNYLYFLSLKIIYSVTLKKFLMMLNHKRL